MTFLLVMTVYAAAVAKPGHGNTAPLAIGLSLYAAAISGACCRYPPSLVHADDAPCSTARVYLALRSCSPNHLNHASGLITPPPVTLQVASTPEPA